MLLFRQRIIFFYILISFLLLVITCNKDSTAPEQEPGNELIINYQLNDYDTPTVIWLADKQNNYFKTLMVSDWLSRDGHRRPGVCPEWSGTAEWDNTPKDEIDAVTTATPAKGQQTITVDCRQRNIADGIYNYLVQSHIKDEYNILYSGKIEIGPEANRDTALVSYIPSKYPDSTRTDILHTVSALYKPTRLK